MNRVFFESDADPAWLAQRFVAVLGFGPVGAMHALCLRDSGVRVTVGVAEDDPNRDEAVHHGFSVTSVAQACEEHDLIVMAEPEVAQQQTYQQHIAANIVPGDALVFGDGLNVSYGFITPPAGVDVLLVAPLAEPDVVRAEFIDGRGVPAIMATSESSSPSAWPLVLAYTRALGGLKAGALYAAFHEHSNAWMFASRAVASGAVPEVVNTAFETLVAGGCHPQVAYLACVQQLSGVVSQVAAAGVAGARADATELECFVGAAGESAVRGQFTEQFRALRDQISSGATAADYFTDQRGGGVAAQRFRRAAGFGELDSAADAVENLFGRRVMTTAAAADYEGV